MLWTTSCKCSLCTRSRNVREQLFAMQTKEEMARCRALAWEMYSSGTVTALVDDKPFHGLEKIPDAVEHMLSGQAIGKVVVSL